jgi:ABC-2 type transport system permease protein
MQEQRELSNEIELRGNTGTLRGFFFLLRLSLARLVRIRPMLVCGVLLALMVTLIVVITRYRAPGIERFTKGPTIGLYLTFLTPIFCICFSTASLANDREDETLVYLLTSPMPRGLVHLAKFISAWLVSMIWVAGGFALICLVAGEVGRQAFQLYWPAIFLAGSAYSSLFHFFGTYFQRATIYALVYALFFEVFVGNVPGTAKRVAVAFYAKCHMVERAGEDLITVRLPPGFQPVEGATAVIALIAITLLFLGLGTLVFQNKEYVNN